MPFFPINLSLDFGYEVPRRGPLLWPVIHSVQSSLTPLSCTSCSLALNGSESQGNHNSFRPHVYILTKVMAAMKNKTFHHCLQIY